MRQNDLDLARRWGNRGREAERFIGHLDTGETGCFTRTPGQQLVAPGI
jgi:hypothetical protein